METKENLITESEHNENHFVCEVEKDGMIFMKLDCTIEEYEKEVNAIKFEDIQWEG